MRNDDYKNALTEAVYTINNAENELFTAMVNIGFNNVYKDISQLYEVGEIINFELAMFERTGDANLDVLVDAIKAVASAKQSLLNLNALDIDPEDLP